MTVTAQTTIHPTAAASSFWVLGDQLSIRGNVSGTPLNIVDVTVPPGSGTPPHSHASAEIFRILEGTIRIWSLVDGAPVETDATAGDVVTIAPHAPHGYRNATSEPARLMAIVDDQMVAFFRDAASDQPLEGPPTPELIGRITGLTARHGITMLDAA